MKFNWTVFLTITLLLMMMGAGVFSAMWGFSLGREALKGVTQPEFRPGSNLSNRSENDSNTNHPRFLREEDILEEVEAQIQSHQPEVTPHSA
ncbi:hypothetical protein NEA10_06765 [Phormidium yuhuli AB48]|uniref:Uncharacterized protein n=1 Tax=Phormidium yuhuli AB48 TaxID=2940671 RepID=A0ABY5AT61_9CYAN|nr:hypothetical protein [Phormidium yuhuli]USR92415.1 hypothetical protein NEA10_06765 [Phormidium yuhuli AB48]